MLSNFGDYDHAASDDLDAILEMSRAEHSAAAAGPSQTRTTYEPKHGEKQIKERLLLCEAEIAEYESEIRSMKALLALRQENRKRLLEELKASRMSHLGKGKGKAGQGIDYASGVFEWSAALKAKMREVFGIDSFRLCQEGVCNANMDGRDIVCVMPTGGGKSLTYQLPALLQTGCTLVISPLISLITDQILHLLDAGVQAVKLTGGTSKEESRDITQRLFGLATHKGASKWDEIKLCYVTPEKIAKSKSFLNLLTKLAAGGQLARIVIDEAHCVSQLGHDFRPDYQKLHTLRQLFPHVPIMALSATCPPKVLEDLIKTLRLKPVVDGTNADTEGTTYFASPLYRKNLHYSVLPKPSSKSDVMKVMTEYILERHPNDSGIIYCLSRKDAENVADDIKKLSNGKIKTGVYHADRHDHDKEGLHKAWRSGTIKVVCATIAFGLGIDKGDVRFVLHHSISKSVEGFYQESGRAGRDGMDSDCVLYYRPQDGTTLSSMVSSEKEGQSKRAISYTLAGLRELTTAAKNEVRAILSFAQNSEECRKTQFAKYFSHSSELSLSSWTTEDSDVLTKCGHCDNCIRLPEEIDRKDVTYQVWQLLKIVAAVERGGGSLTLNMLAGLAKGAGGGVYEVAQGGRSRKGGGKTKEKVELDLDEVAGGVVDLTKDEIEHLLVDMLLQQYLKERYQSTAYTTTVYMTLGSLSHRLTKHDTRESLQKTIGLKIECVFRKRTKTKISRPKLSKDRPLDGKPRSRAGKRKRDISDFENEEDDIVIVPDEDEKVQAYERVSDSEGEDDIVDDWLPTMRSVAPPPKKRRGMGTNGFVQKIIKENDTEVLVLSD